MTKQQIIEKINKLKEEKTKLEYLVDAQDVRQHSFKIFLNSSYGALGSVFYPCYDLDNAEAVTMSGQTVTRQMVRYTNELLNKLMIKNGGQENSEGYVIAGDTDSVSGNTNLKIKKIKKIKINGNIELLPQNFIKIKRNNKILTIKAKQLKKGDELVGF